MMTTTQIGQKKIEQALKDAGLRDIVELTVTETEPGFKGDTSSNTTKPATLETGLTVNVPLFVNTGDKLKIEQRTYSLQVEGDDGPVGRGIAEPAPLAHGGHPGIDGLGAGEVSLWCLGGRRSHQARV